MITHRLYFTDTHGQIHEGFADHTPEGAAKILAYWQGTIARRGSASWCEYTIVRVEAREVRRLTVVHTVPGIVHSITVRGRWVAPLNPGRAYTGTRRFDR